MSFDIEQNQCTTFNFWTLCANITEQFAWIFSALMWCNLPTKWV